MRTIATGFATNRVSLLPRRIEPDARWMYHTCMYARTRTRTRTPHAHTRTQHALAHARAYNRYLHTQLSILILFLFFQDASSPAAAASFAGVPAEELAVQTHLLHHILQLLVSLLTSLPRHEDLCVQTLEFLAAHSHLVSNILKVNGCVLIRTHRPYKDEHLDIYAFSTRMHIFFKYTRSSS